MKRVVITGMGIWSCIGTNVEEVKNSLYNGISGIGIDQDRIDYGYRSGLTGIVKRPQLKGVLDRRTRMGLSEEAEYAFMASKDAFQMAGIDDDGGVGGQGGFQGGECDVQQGGAAEGKEGFGPQEGRGAHARACAGRQNEATGGHGAEGIAGWGLGAKRQNASKAAG